MIERSTALLHLLVDGMRSTQTTELKYLIQQSAPVVLRHLDWAQLLRKRL